jgi:hypothetical protein
MDCAKGAMRDDAVRVPAARRICGSSQTTSMYTGVILRQSSYHRLRNTTLAFAKDNQWLLTWGNSAGRTSLCSRTGVRGGTYPDFRAVHCHESTTIPSAALNNIRLFIPVIFIRPDIAEILNVIMRCI